MSIGTLVGHAYFGTGAVEAVLPDGRIIVKFRSEGLHTLSQTDVQIIPEGMSFDF